MLCSHHLGVAGACINVLLSDIDSIWSFRLQYHTSTKSDIQTSQIYNSGNYCSTTKKKKIKMEAISLKDFARNASVCATQCDWLLYNSCQFLFMFANIHAARTLQLDINNIVLLELSRRCLCRPMWRLKGRTPFPVCGSGWLRARLTNQIDPPPPGVRSQ